LNKTTAWILILLGLGSFGAIKWNIGTVPLLVPLGIILILFGSIGLYTEREDREAEEVADDKEWEDVKKEENK